MKRKLRGGRRYFRQLAGWPSRLGLDVNAAHDLWLAAFVVVPRGGGGVGGQDKEHGALAPAAAAPVSAPTRDKA